MSDPRLALSPLASWALIGAWIALVCVGRVGVTRWLRMRRARRCFGKRGPLTISTARSAPPARGPQHSALSLALRAVVRFVGRVLA